MAKKQKEAWAPSLEVEPAEETVDVSNRVELAAGDKMAKQRKYHQLSMIKWNAKRLVLDTLTPEQRAKVEFIEATISYKLVGDEPRVFKVLKSEKKESFV